LENIRLAVRSVRTVEFPDESSNDVYSEAKKYKTDFQNKISSFQIILCNFLIFKIENDDVSLIES